MRNFFNVQFDYIYFFYGLAFFLLAIICLSIRRDQRQLPWLFLGLFGLVHGINEWMEIFVIGFEPNGIFPLVHVMILGLSYLFLFEFARRGFLMRDQKVLGLWIYPIPLILAFLGIKYGTTGLNISFRYFLGFPAGLLTSLVIFRASKLYPSERRPLLILSTAMFFYSILAGLIVPYADFSPAKEFNTDAFFRIAGIPVQLFRGILALLSAMAIWFYNPSLAKVQLEPRKYSFSFIPSRWAILLTLVGLIWLGWVFTNYLDYWAGHQFIRNSKTSANSPLNLLINELAGLEESAVSISQLTSIKEAITGREPQDLQKAALILEGYKLKSELLDCILLDDKGDVVASCGGIISDNTAVKSSVPAALFQQAISGDIGYQYQLGRRKNERIFDVSAPVKDQTGNILGVVNLRKNILAKPIIVYRLISICFTMFICLVTIVYFLVLRRRENVIRLIQSVNAQLHALDRMKTDFVATTSHELRTPLTSIKNAVTILMKSLPHKTLPQDREKELLEIILNNTNRQARIVNDLLDISKIESGVMTVKKEPADMGALAREAVHALENLAENKWIKLRVVSNREPLVVPLDVEKTLRIFTNLVHNAIKFTPEKGRVTVKIEETPSEVRVRVSDTGIGITQEDVEKIFDKFYRSSQIQVRQQEGIGLGLLITKGLVEAQGGKIWVESELNKGSAFTFTLPWA